MVRKGKWENLADEEPPKASVPLATPLLTSPLLPPTLTMVTPALLFLPDSSGFFSCGLKDQDVYDVQIRLRSKPVHSGKVMYATQLGDDIL